MSLELNLTFSDSDLQLFVDARNRQTAEAQQKAESQDPARIVADTRTLLQEIRSKPLPEFVASRLKHVETMIDMVDDVGFGLPEENRKNVLAALAYFSSPSDLVPDDVPVLGFIDDAIVIELCVRELQPEIEAYCDFHRWRDNEATRRGDNKSGLALSRVDWAEARREETLARMHRRRSESYANSRLGPSLFRVR